MHCSHHNYLQYHKGSGGKGGIVSRLTQRWHCAIATLISTPVQTTCGSLMQTMGRTGLFTVGEVEALCRRRDAFERDSLLTVTPSPESSGRVFTPQINTIWRFTRKTSCWDTYSNHWDIGSNCVTLCFRNGGQGLKVLFLSDFALEY